VAMQQGNYLAKQFKKKPANPKPFKYIDLGSMATIGKNKAVADFAFAKFQGFFAWLMWIFIHIMHLVGYRNRVAVFLNWATSYFNSDKRFRLIIRPYASKNPGK
jgi:NADH dehydrogenase